MSTDKHTPGPWGSRGTLGPVSAQHLRGPCVVEVVATGQMIAHLSGFRTEQQAFDAQLMASAPDLLEALRAMCDRWEPDCEGTDRRMWEAGRAAIAKATGEPA